MLLNGQKILAALGSKRLVAGIQSNQGVLKLILLVGNIQAVCESINTFALINRLDARHRGRHLGHVTQTAFLDRQQAAFFDHGLVLSQFVFDGLDIY